MRAAVIGTPSRRIAVVVLVVIVATLCAFVVATRHRVHAPSTSAGSATSRTSHPTKPSSSTGDPSPSASPSEPHATTPVPIAVPALVRTDDPAAYARAVAEALFTVTESQVTRSAFLRFWGGELPSVVYADAAAKGLTLRRQDSDAISNLTTWWIPSQPVWNSEAAQDLTSRFLITSVAVPDYWANAVADGTFRDPGLRMERVMGVLTQSYGTDVGHRESSSRSVVIDVGLLCGPTQPGGCRLLAPQQPDSAGS